MAHTNKAVFTQNVDGKYYMKHGAVCVKETPQEKEKECFYGGPTSPCDVENPWFRVYDECVLCSNHYELKPYPWKISIPSTFSFTSEEVKAAFIAVGQFASAIGLGHEFQNAVDSLLPGSPVKIHFDFAPASFTWEGCGMFGGFIFHGNPAEIEKSHKLGTWSLHT